MRVFGRILKWLGIALLCLFIGLQFKRPARTNPAVDPSQTMQAHLQMPSDVTTILNKSCQDCHSHTTRWPWYSNVAPFSWLLVDHVNEGREHLNFSEWGRLDNRRARNKLEEICEEVEIGAMPLDSYTWIHRSAILSQEEIKKLCEWANAERARMEHQ